MWEEKKGDCADFPQIICPNPAITPKVLAYALHLGQAGSMNEVAKLCH